MFWMSEQKFQKAAVCSEVATALSFKTFGVEQLCRLQNGAVFGICLFRTHVGAFHLHGEV